MIKKLFIFLLVNSLFVVANAQQLVVNEFSQGGSGNKEYIELVVVGTRTCTDSTMDIRKWVVDDQNGWYGGSGTGIAQGHYRFADHLNWSKVPYGSIILLYNNTDKNGSITLADDETDANHDYVYIVPVGSTYIEEFSATPLSPSSPTYTYPTTGYTSSVGTNWTSRVGLANGGDAIIIANPAALGTAAFSIAYGLTIGTPFQTPTVSVGAVAGGDNCYLSNNLFTNAASWIVGSSPTNETPGAGNVTANTTWINSMRVQAAGGARPTAGSNSPVCVGGTLNLTASTIPGATYTWTGPGFSSSTQNPSITSVTAANAGKYFVKATVAGCTSAPDSVVVVVNPIPVISGTATANPTTCSGTNGTITLNGLTASTSYSITYLRGATPVTVTLTSNASGAVTITGLGAGTYSNIAAALSGCTSAPVGPLTLTDPAAPAPPTPGSNSPVCAGSALNLTASTIAGAIYSWSGPNSFTSSTQNPTIASATAANAGKYYVKATVAGCGSATDSILVVVNPLPAISSVTFTSPTSCGGTNGTISLNGLTANTTYTINYLKGATPVTVTLTSNAAGVVTITALGPDTYTNITAVLNGCTSASAGPVTLVNATAPVAPTVVSPIAYCQGVAAVPLTATGTNLRFYTVATGGTGLTTLTPSTAAPGTFTYYVASQAPDGCESARTPIVVTINARPAPPVVNGTITLCQFSVSPALTAAGTNLLWYGTATGGTPSATPPVPGTIVPGTFNYYVSQTVSGCESGRSQISVNVIAKPAPPTVVSPLGLCQYDQVTLTADGSGTFLWYYTPTGGVGIPQMIPNTAYEDSAYYYVTQTVNGCESDRTRMRVFVSYKPNGIVTPSRLWVCEGEVDTFMYFGNSSAPQATFNWTSSRTNNQIISGQGTAGPVVVLFDSAGLHTVSVQVNNRGCLSTIATQPISVRPNPRLTFITKEEACQDELIDVALTGMTPGIDSFTYSFPGAEIVYGAGSGGPYGIRYNTWGAKIITSVAHTRECPSRTYADTIIVHPLPDTRFRMVSNSSICAGDTLVLEVLRPDSGTRYFWTPDRFFTNGNIFRATGTIMESGFIKVSGVSFYGCRAADSLYLQTGMCCELYFPNAFTPNNDTKNDVFRPVTKGHHIIKTFRVINRWGQVIFESKNDRSAWDGTFNGKPQDGGTYYYYIRYSCLEGGAQDLEQKGEVMLIR